ICSPIPRSSRVLSKAPSDQGKNVAQQPAWMSHGNTSDGLSHLPISMPLILQRQTAPPGCPKHWASTSCPSHVPPHEQEPSGPPLHVPPTQPVPPPPPLLPDLWHCSSVAMAVEHAELKHSPFMPAFWAIHSTAA